jgi:DNA gyrase subunit B
MRDYLEEHPKEAKTIADKIILSATARHAALKARTEVLRKSPLGGAGLPGKLAVCSSRTAEDCELFIVEGDSAGGSAKKARDRHIQAILPIRGKILNVEKASKHKIFENQEITALYRALRVTPSQEEGKEDDVDISKIAYHKIIIMTDADVDGSHIDTLLMTFFFRRMRAVIENGYLYIASSPLYKVSQKNGKNAIYCWDDRQLREAMEKIGNGAQVQRYKGLGEMDANELKETTMDPENRILKQVNISDAIEADRIFSMLMGEDVSVRRDFIEANAVYANIDA